LRYRSEVSSSHSARSRSNSGCMLAEVPNEQRSATRRSPSADGLGFAQAYDRFIAERMMAKALLATISISFALLVAAFVYTAFTL
jgi:hypothetical protein